MSLSPLEFAIIRAAASLLGHAAAHGLTVCVRGTKKKVLVEADPEDVARSAEPDVLLRFAARRMFGEQEREILKLLRGQDLKADAIARSLGKDAADTSLRTLLALMSERELLASGRNGYSVADPRVFELLDLSDSVAE